MIKNKTTNSKIIVLDSYALLVFLNDEPGADKVEFIIREGTKKKKQLFMNEINLGEVFYRIAQTNGLEFAEERISEIFTLKINWILPDRAMVLNAARFKARFPISYAGAFLAATCLKTGGRLLTGDPEFEKLANEINIQWLPKKASK